MSYNTAANNAPPSAADAAAVAAVTTALVHAQGATVDPSTTSVARDTSPEPRDVTNVPPSDR